MGLLDQLRHKVGSSSSWNPRMRAEYKEEDFGCQGPAEQFVQLSSYIKFELLSRLSSRLIAKGPSFHSTDCSTNFDAAL